MALTLNNKIIIMLNTLKESNLLFDEPFFISVVVF